MKRKIKVSRISFYAILLMCTYGCRSSGSFYTTDGQLALAMASMDTQSEGTISYRVRITVSDTRLLEVAKNNSESMMYRSDSCFFISAGTKRIYPLALQPVANGVGISFEFMLVFPGQIEGMTHPVFVYQDRYLNRREYQFTITE